MHQQLRRGMKIDSRRLKFRQYNDDDFDFLFDLLADSEMVRYIGDGKTKDREGTKNFLKWI